MGIIGFEADLSQPPNAWPVIDNLLSQLVMNYSRIMDVRIPGDPQEDLLWDILDVRATYADPALEPDCDHVCIALLVAEGVADEIVSANWDGLIEKAHERLRGGRGSSLKVCVRAEDFRAPDCDARLLKLHGCAVLADRNASDYRPYLIASQRQIDNWLVDPRMGVMRNELKSLATLKRTLMVGLSGQDHNIRNVFGSASGTLRWSWPCDPPAIVFAEDRLDLSHDALLSCVYSLDTFDLHRDDIRDSALLRAFSKPLLSAFFIHLIFTKAKALLALIPEADLPVTELPKLERGIDVLRERVARAADPGGLPNDRLKMILKLARQISRGLRIFQSATAPTDPNEYFPITDKPLHRIADDPVLVDQGMHLLAAVLSLLGLAEQDNRCVLKPANPDDASTGSLIVATRSEDRRTYLIQDGDQLAQLVDDGIIDWTYDDATIIMAKAREKIILPRSPRRRLGRSGRASLIQVPMKELLACAGDADALYSDFKAALVI